MPRRHSYGPASRTWHLAVIGFDDNGYGALSSPTLTTVHIDAEAHGRQAARAILGLPAGDLSLVPGRVVIRESA